MDCETTTEELVRPVPGASASAAGADGSGTANAKPAKPADPADVTERVPPVDANHTSNQS